MPSSPWQVTLCVLYYNIIKQQQELKMKTYKTYQARNAVKAALVTNYIKAQKKLGVDHNEAKAEAYRIYNIKAGLPYILNGLKVKELGLPPLPRVNNMKITKAEKPAPPKPDLFKSMGLPSLPPLPKIGA